MFPLTSILSHGGERKYKRNFTSPPKRGKIVKMEPINGS